MLLLHTLKAMQFPFPARSLAPLHGRVVSTRQSQNIPVLGK